jgi:PBSX family phage terminase large subunit
MDFLESPEDYTLFCGGLGSGKTYAGAVWAVKMALDNPGVAGLITANSYSQLKKATLTKFFEILDKLQIPFKYKVNDGIIEIFDSKIYAISMEKYDLLRGIEVGWAWSDECAFYKEEAFNVLIGRIRDKTAPCQWKGTTTPNGFNWLYSTFVESPLPKSTVITSNTLDNLENLHEGYVNALKAQYDTKLAQQELDGQFINLTSGKVYYAFNRDKHVQPVDERNALMYVGLDFNVNPLCGVFCFQRDHKIYVSQELYQHDSNTFKAAKEILARYPYQPIKVVPDSTGDRRRSSAKNTDHEILRRAYLDVVPFTNPSQKDRFNNLNRLLDHNMLYIDPKCTKLIEDLEKLTHDNKDEMLGHITDALGYACWHLNPLKKPRRPARVRYY